MIESLYWVIRIMAVTGGALIGFVLTGPLVRILYRLAFQRPVPSWAVPPSKLAGAVLVGALIFHFVVFGGGSGWGWGPGSGAGTGAIGDDGGKTGIATVTQEGKAGKGPARIKYEIELLGGNRVAADGRYYLLQRKPPAKTLEEVEADIKDQTDKLEVHVVLTDESVASSHPAVARLRELLQRYRIPTLEPRDK